MSALDRVPVITFLSDYGPWDEFVGVCHAVIARRAPRARIIDLGHGVARHDIRAGALALRAALPYAPAGVHLAVVDPGVGGARRAVALRVAAAQRTPQQAEVLNNHFQATAPELQPLRDQIASLKKQLDDLKAELKPFESNRANK